MYVCGDGVYVCMGKVNVYYYVHMAVCVCVCGVGEGGSECVFDLLRVNDEGKL